MDNVNNTEPIPAKPHGEARLVKVIFTEDQINNVMVFLDRVRYNGLKDISAVQSIISAMQNGEVQDKGVYTSEPPNSNRPPINM